MKWEIEKIKVKELSTGDALSIKTYTVRAGKGAHIHIQASVHGAEIQGNAVILQLMQALKNEEISGSITIVPLANPYATLNKHGTYTYGRYNPVTGDNWNRNYIDIAAKCDFDYDSFCKSHLQTDWEEIKKDFKKEIAQSFKRHIDKLKLENTIQDNNRINIILQELALPADGIMDLHTGPSATRYLYCAEYAQEVAKHLLFKNVLIMPDVFGGAMDEAGFSPWIKLIQTFKRLNREIKLDVESFTLEFGSEETFCMSEGQKDVESILNYLRYKKVIKGAPKWLEKTRYCRLKDYKTIYAPRGGLVDYHLAPGDDMKQGAAMATFYQFNDLDPNDPLKSCATVLKAPSDGIVINRCPSSNVHQGMELYQVMTKVY